MDENGKKLTILLAIIGIIAGVITSFYFYELSKSDDNSTNNEINKKLDDIDTISDVTSQDVQKIKTMLSQIVEDQKKIYEIHEIQIQIESNAEINIPPETQKKIEDQSKQIKNLQTQLRESGETVDVDIDLMLKEMSSYYYVKEYDKMLSISNAILSIESNNKHALNGKALAFYGKENYDESIFWYDKALEIDPDYSVALSNKGAALYQLKKYSESIIYFDKALEIDPDYVSALSNKGAALYQLGQRADAKPFFDKALEIDPDYSSAKKWIQKYR